MACADDLLVQPEVSSPGIPQIPPGARKALEAAGTVGPILVAQPKGSSRVFVAVPGDSVTPSTSRRLRAAQHGGPDAHEEDLILIVNPSGPWTGGADSTQTVGWTAFCRTGPGDLIPMDMRVDSIDQAPIAGTGGHLFDHQGQKPRGSWDPRSGNSVATVFPTVYTARHASGDERIRFTYEITDPNAPPECRGATVDTTFMNGVRYPSDGFELIHEAQLVELVEGVNGIVFDAITSNHTSVFYLTAAARLATNNTADYFSRHYSQHGLFRVNAASLVFGGLNDISFNWSTAPLGHKTHRIGTDVDIDIIDFDGSSADRDSKFYWDLLIEAGTMGGKFLLCEIHNRNHVHCYHQRY